MKSPACQPLEQGHDSFGALVPASRLHGRKFEVRRQRRGPYSGPRRRRGRIAVRELRIDLGLSQAQLSVRSGVCLSTICRIESGHGWPCERSSRRLAKALGVSRQRFEELLDLPIEGREIGAAS